MAPALLVTGFGSFADVDLNPSGRVALALGRAAGVRGVELPVSFRAAPLAIDAVLEELAPERPRVILATGVHPGASFRLERRARSALRAERPDNEGVSADDLALPDGPDLETAFDLEPLARVLRRAGATRVEVSDDAGGYVCERVYRHVLELAARGGVPALFLHVPPVGVMSVETQVAVVGALVAELRRVVGGVAMEAGETSA